MACTGIVLAFIDYDCLRLPHSVVAAMAIGGLIFLATAALQNNHLRHFTEVVVLGLIVFASFLTLALTSRRGLGFGDVTLFATVSLYLGWFGWRHVVYGILAAFTLGAVTAVALRSAGRIGSHDHFALGPCIIAGALLTVLIQPTEVAA
ncbi:prepilin peptidase [Actinosynnema sp. CS-041913]|uniref:prepilin peptidase n=1 Tax=Actinosynnema sp. CS-041913 TaxID=3239917 RepID=UPI003D8C33F6